jgi:hypothetical protein
VAKGRPVEVGGLAAVGELHAEAQELVGHWVVFEGAVVEQVGKLLLLADGEVADTQAEREGEPVG